MILELGQHHSSLDFIRITAEYSNAVLVAILPYINGVAQKLDLPVPHPISTADVFHCSIMPRRALGAEIGVAGGWFFQFQRGYVRVIQGPRSYYSLQDPDEVPKYYGSLRMSAPEAVSLARSTITNLRIPLEDVFADQEPEVQGPEHVDANLVPYYCVSWFDPRGGAVASASIEINGEAKRVERIAFRNVNLERPPPAVRVDSTQAQSTPRFPLVNPAYAWKLVPITLKALETYALKLSLPIPHPLTTNHVAQFSIADNGGWPHCEIELTNGWRFIYRNDMVNGYTAPDNFFNSDRKPIHIRDFVGRCRTRQAESIALVHTAVAKLGFSTNLAPMNFDPTIHKPRLASIPRILLTWTTENEDDLQTKIEAEVDLDKGELKSLYFDNKKFWNHPPPIDVPISLPDDSQTNSKEIRTQHNRRPNQDWKIFDPAAK